MTMTAKSMIHDLSPDIGVCRQSFNGDSKISFYLVATKPGGPPETEKRVLQVLNHIHQSGNPVQRVFINLDLSQKNGETQTMDANLHPYRSFPDPEITKDIADYFIRSKMVSAAWAFAVTCQPEVPLRICEDWYHRANFRDKLRKLSLDAGKIEALIELVKDGLSQQSIPYENWEILLKLVRLELTTAEWSLHYSQLEGLFQEFQDIFLTLVPYGRSMAEFFVKRLQDASDLYQSEMIRADALLDQALEQMQLNGNNQGVIEIGVEMVDYLAGILRNKDITFAQLDAVGVEMVSMLDQAGLLLNVSDDQHNRLGDLFTGKEIRTRIQVLEEELGASKKARSDEWAQASLNLGVLYENARHNKQHLEKADECAKIALQLASDNAAAWWATGQVDLLKYDYAHAVENYDRAIQLSPMNGTYWRNRGMALDALHQTKTARDSYYRSIYCNPKDGGHWGQLGFHFYNHSLKRKSCYCLKKGSELGDAIASQNYHTATQWSSPSFGCPLPLLPPVIYCMNRFVLPMRHDRKFAEETRLNVELALFGLALLAGAVYGAWTGALAGGILGGVVAFLLGTLGAGIAFFAVLFGLRFMGDPDDSRSISWWNPLLRSLILVVLAVVVGYHIGSDFGQGLSWGGELWDRFRSQMFGILTAGLFSLLGSILYLIVIGILEPSATPATEQTEKKPTPVENGDRSYSDLLSMLGVGVLYIALYWLNTWQSTLLFFGYLITALLVRSLFRSLRRTRTVSKAEYSIHIKAPRERVFDTLADYEIISKIIYPGTQSITPTKEPLSVGTRWVLRIGLFRLRRSEHVITAYQRPDYCARQVKGSMQGMVEYFLEPDAQGTKVTERIEMKRVAWPGTADATVQSAPILLKMIKQYLESRTAETSTFR
jgi:tetratricopeptide (TPR) repeat protein/carbon monoxide dehydrogenase subunit G